MGRRGVWLVLVVWVATSAANMVFHEALDRLFLGQWPTGAILGALLAALLLYLLYPTAVKAFRGLRSGRISYEDINRILERYETVSGDLCFHFPESDEDNLRKRLKCLKMVDWILPWRRPVIFATFGFRDSLFWVDYVYLELLSDFADLGFDVRVVIHDEDFLLRVNGVAPRYLDENGLLFKNFAEFLRETLKHGGKLSFYCGHDLANRSRRMRKLYVDLIYDRLIPYLSSVLDQAISRELPHRSALGEVINTIDSFLVLSMPQRPILIGVYFVERAWKWRVSPLGDVKAEASMIILEGDIVRPKTSRSVVHDPDARIDLLDEPTRMAAKVFGSDDDTLRTIAKVLLGRDPAACSLAQELRGVAEDRLRELARDRLSSMLSLAPEQEKRLIWDAIAGLNGTQTTEAARALLSTPQLEAIYLRHMVLTGLNTMRSSFLTGKARAVRRVASSNEEGQGTA